MEYTSNSQRARVLSEFWVANHAYCLACTNESLRQTPANTRARDFECNRCGHPYELKSSIRPFQRKVVDGAYRSMMERIEDGTVASFLLLQYDRHAAVTHLTAIHRSFITPEVIEERKPLSSSARRAGWVGCNLLMHRVPPEGRISLMHVGIEVPRFETRAVFSAVSQLSKETSSGRSWARALLTCLHRLNDEEFSLAQVYSFEAELKLLYPGNKNVRAKIRQQLQVLRDAGLLIFKGHGFYKLAFNIGKGKYGA